MLIYHETIFISQAIEQIDGELIPDALRPVELVFEVPTRPGKLESMLITASCTFLFYA